MDVNEEEFSFESLEAKLDGYAPSVPLLGGDRKTRLAFLAVFLSGAVGILASYVFTGRSAQVVALVAMFIELVAVATIVINTIREDLPEFLDAKRRYASKLETDYSLYRELLDWVRKCPVDKLKARYQYLQTRQETFDRRLRMVTGGVERLGMFPIVVALYFQFKDVQWWPPVFDLKNALLAFVVAIIYAMCLWLVRLRLRLDMYVLVLGDALGDGGMHSEGGA